LKAFITEKPFSFRFEMVDFIAEEFDVDVSENTISRFLQNELISRKKAYTLANAVFLIIVTKGGKRTLSFPS
jgi:transposase